MKKNLKQKVVIIFGVLIVFLYGAFFGFDAPNLSGNDPMLNKLTRHIHLGLDLKGGSRLVLQVQVQDAIRSDADHVKRMSDGIEYRRAIPGDQSLGPVPCDPAVFMLDRSSAGRQPPVHASHLLYFFFWS